MYVNSELDPRFSVDVPFSESAPLKCITTNCTMPTVPQPLNSDSYSSDRLRISSRMTYIIPSRWTSGVRERQGESGEEASLLDVVVVGEGH